MPDSGRGIKMTNGMVTQTYVYTAVRATRPWQSIYAEPVYDIRLKRTSEVYTDQNQINLCLNCPQAECNNCLDGWRLLKYARPRGKAKKRRV